MVCSAVRGDNPRVLASGLSFVQADNPLDITILNHSHQCRSCSVRNISCLTILRSTHVSVVDGMNTWDQMYFYLCFRL